MYTLQNPLPRTCTWTPDHGLRRRCSCSSCQSPQRPPPPPLFEKYLDPRHDVVLVLHLNCGSNCQYMYRYMYMHMHPPPTPTKYRLFTIRKHAFLSLFLNDAMLRACRSMQRFRSLASHTMNMKVKVAKMTQNVGWLLRKASLVFNRQIRLGDSYTVVIEKLVG